MNHFGCEKSGAHDSTTPSYGEGSMYERNRLVFNASPETENFEATMLKAHEIIAILHTVRPRSHVADIGCHSGISTVEYAKLTEVQSVEGFDIADQALAAAEKRGLKVFKWSAGRETCPAVSDRYDVVIASEVIEHIVDTEFFISEIRRILKTNGHVILTTPNLYYWLSRLKFLFGEAPWSYPGVSSEFKVDRNIITEHIRINGVNEWSAFFRARGFDILRTKGLSWASPITFKGRIIRWIDGLMPKNAKCLALFLLRKTK